MVRKTEIIDIRVGSTDFDMVADIKKGLNPKDGGEKRLPTLLLYDEVWHTPWLLLQLANLGRLDCGYSRKSPTLMSTSKSPCCVESKLSLGDTTSPMQRSKSCRNMLSRSHIACSQGRLLSSSEAGTYSLTGLTVRLYPHSDDTDGHLQEPSKGQHSTPSYRPPRKRCGVLRS